MNILSRLKLKKEANLLDSKWYILKTFLAIATAYVIFSHVPLVKRDMISVLFGLVLTLEPVNRAGIKNGWDQIFASFIGAVATSLIVLFFGVSPITVGASVALTLYICLLINWKSVSAVALFTAIYMTQYLQVGPDGHLSVWLTFQLRFAALSSGVLVAIVYNYLFSLIQYRQISSKRTAYLFKQLLLNMQLIQTELKAGERGQFKGIRVQLLETTNQVEWIAGLMAQLHKEVESDTTVTLIKKEKLRLSRAVIDEMRNIGHLMFDVCYLLGDEKIETDVLKANQEKLVGFMEEITSSMTLLKCHFEDEKTVLEPVQPIMLQGLAETAYLERLLQDMQALNESLNKIMALLEG